MALDQLPGFIRENYEVHESKHASAVLTQDFPAEWEDVCDVLMRFRLYRQWISVGGGNRSELAGWFDQEFSLRGWLDKQFKTANGKVAGIGIRIERCIA